MESLIDSHMLKHAVIHHEARVDDVKFKVEIIRNHKSAFERQLHEAVEILLHNKGNLMNSKSEYNRCSVPRL